jgi:hypothetical protein
MSYSRVKVVAFLATVALVFMFTELRAFDSGVHRNVASNVCAVDSPAFAVRAYWRSALNDTSSDNVTERTASGLVDVPVDSIDYVTDETKCSTALASLNALNRNPDTLTHRRTITLISWKGVRYLAPLGAGQEQWAVFDSTLAFLWFLSPLSD